MSKLSLCLECKNCSLLSLNINRNKELLIQCEHCGYNQYYSIHKYLEEVKDLPIIKNKTNYCHEHNQIYTQYCLKSKKYLCAQCDNH